MRYTSYLAAIVTLLVAQASLGQANIAVVNIPAASERYQKTADIESRIEQRRKELRRERDERRDALERGARALQEDFRPGTDEYAKRERELAQTQWELQYFEESESKIIEREMAAAMLEIYNDIRAAVKVIAQQRGLDLVMAADPDPEQQAETTSQVRQQIVLQKVVYFSAELDITQEVVDRLNAQYKAQSGGGSAPPADDSGQ